MPPSSTTPAPLDGDAETVRLLRAQDAAGLRRLLAEHGSRTRVCIRRSFGGALSETEVDEVLNEAAFRAWRAAPNFDSSRGPLRAWFLVIARNVGLELLRQRRRRGYETRGDIEQLEAAQAADPGEGAGSHGFLSALHGCIDRLPALQRRIIRADLRAGDVADAGDLAKALRTTKNSIYVSRSLARKTLKKQLLAQGFLSEEGFVTGAGRSEPKWT